MPEALVDVIENTLRRHDDLLEILLMDRTKTTKAKTHNILWATDSYSGHKPKDEIGVLDITGPNTFLIQPRISKSKEEQKIRTKEKAEVFTPKRIVQEMNQQADWKSGHWPVTKENWKQYVSELRLEITCGEAPFIVGRYNAYNGKKVYKLSDRVGFLDKKLQKVSEFAETKEEWLEWALESIKCSYGYEWQGDNLLLARENILYTFIDYWNEQFPKSKINLNRKISDEKLNILKEVATIISWNIFQMDGINFTVPMSSTSIKDAAEIPPLCILFGEKPPKPKGKPPTYVKIMDWRKNKTIKFIDVVKKG